MNSSSSTAILFLDLGRGREIGPCERERAKERVAF